MDFFWWTGCNGMNGCKWTQSFGMWKWYIAVVYNLLFGWRESKHCDVSCFHGNFLFFFLQFFLPWVYESVNYYMHWTWWHLVSSQVVFWSVDPVKSFLKYLSIYCVQRGTSVIADTLEGNEDQWQVFWQRGHLKEDLSANKKGLGFEVLQFIPRIHKSLSTILRPHTNRNFTVLKNKYSPKSTLKLKL